MSPLPPRPCSPPAKSRIPWITIKDLLWLLYLYPGRWLARLGVLKLIQRAAETMFQIIARPRKPEVMRRLVPAFGPAAPLPDLQSVADRFIANAVRQVFDDLALAQTEGFVHCHAFKGREHLDAALKAGKGVLLAGLHWYAGRAGNRYLTSLGYPVMSVRNEEPLDKRMGRVGRRLFQPRYVRFLHEVIRDEVFIQDRECSLKILARLRKGGIVHVLLDAFLSQQNLEVPFLGQTRLFPAGPLHLARISGCAVLPMCALGHAQALEILIGPPLPLDYSLDAESFCQTHLPALVRILESYVLEHPDQWELWTKL